MREPCQGVPISGMGGGESPFYAVRCEAREDVGIVSDIIGVVQVYEVMAFYLPVSGEGCQGQGQIDPSDLIFAC